MRGQGVNNTGMSLCPGKPVPFAGTSVPPFPSLVRWPVLLAPAPRLADGEARRVKSSAYSLHQHEGHRAAVGLLESSLRGRIQPGQCHLQDTFSPRSEDISGGNSKGCRAGRGCGPALYRVAASQDSQRGGPNPWHCWQPCE